MASELKKWFSSPFALAWYPAIFTVSVPFVIDWWKGQAAFTTAIYCLDVLRRFGIWILYGSFSLEIQVYWIPAFAVSIGLTITLKRWYEKRYPKIDSKILEYKSDVFKNWKWKWRWKHNAKIDRWYIDQLRAECPRCKVDLQNLSSDFGLYFKCPSGDFTSYSETEENPNDIKALIYHKVQNEFNIELDLIRQ